MRWGATRRVDAEQGNGGQSTLGPPYFHPWYMYAFCFEVILLFSLSTLLFYLKLIIRKWQSINKKIIGTYNIKKTSKEKLNSIFTLKGKQSLWWGIVSGAPKTYLKTIEQISKKQVRLSDSLDSWECWHSIYFICNSIYLNLICFIYCATTVMLSSERAVLRLPLIWT